MAKAPGGCCWGTATVGNMTPPGVCVVGAGPPADRAGVRGAGKLLQRGKGERMQVFLQRGRGELVQGPLQRGQIERANWFRKGDMRVESIPQSRLWSDQSALT